MRGCAIFRRHAVPPPGRRALHAWLAIGLCVATAPAWSVVTVSEPWVRLGRGAQPAEAYMEIRSSEGGALVRFAAPTAHEVTLQAPGKAQAPLARLALPPAKRRDSRRAAPASCCTAFRH